MDTVSRPVLASFRRRHRCHKLRHGRGHRLDVEDRHALPKGLRLATDGPAKRGQAGARRRPSGLQADTRGAGGRIEKTSRRGNQNRRGLLRKHGGAYCPFSGYLGPQNRRTTFPPKCLAILELAPFSYRYTPYSLQVSIIACRFAGTALSTVAPVERMYPPS